MNGIFNVLLKAKSDIQITHILQKDKKYSTHMILGSLYEKLDDKTDGMIERYLGLGHKLDTLSYQASEINGTIISYIEKLFKDIEAAKAGFTDTIFVNDLEEIQSLLASCLYKLKFVQ